MSDGRVSLEALYREIAPKIWRSVLAYSADPEIASDAVAEAFMQALRRGEAIRKFEPWLWQAAFRIAAGELAERRRILPPQVERSYEIPAPSGHLVDALRQLPANQRVAIVMHDYADRPVSEVAQVLGIGHGTVYVHLSRGRHRLRSILGDDHE